MTQVTTKGLSNYRYAVYATKSWSMTVHGENMGRMDGVINQVGLCYAKWKGIKICFLAHTKIVNR